LSFVELVETYDLISSSPKKHFYQVVWPQTIANDIFAYHLFYNLNIG